MTQPNNQETHDLWKDEKETWWWEALMKKRDSNNFYMRLPNGWYRKLINPGDPEENFFEDIDRALTAKGFSLEEIGILIKEINKSCMRTSQKRIEAIRREVSEILLLIGSEISQQYSLRELVE